MGEIMTGTILFSMATIANLGMLKVLNIRGEANAEPAPETKTFTQEQVNHLMAEHKRGLQTELESSQKTLNDLKTELDKYRQMEEQKSQQDLEAKQQYEKLKEGWVTKESEYKNILSQKDSAIQDMTISNALTNEVIKQNAHSDVVQLVKSLAQVDEKGEVRIKGKNVSGIEELLSVEEGLKSFLKERPYLVKASGQGGGGTPPAGQGGGNTNLNSDPMADATELQNAMRSGDRKKVMEIKTRIAAKRQTQQAII